MEQLTEQEPRKVKAGRSHGPIKTSQTHLSLSLHLDLTIHTRNGMTTLFMTDDARGTGKSSHTPLM